MELGAGGAKHRSTIFLKLSLVFSISSFSAIKINDLTAYLKSTQTQLVMITETNPDQRNTILSFLLKTTINLLTNVQNLHSSNFSSRACYPKPTATVNYRLHFVWNYLDENTVSFNDLNVLHSRKLILSLSKGWIYAEKARRNDFIESTTFIQVLIPKKEVWVGAYFSMDWLESHLKASPYVVLIHQSI